MQGQINLDLDYCRKACEEFRPDKYDYSVVLEFMIKYQPDKLKVEKKE